jgi:hypothetical protein
LRSRPYISLNSFCHASIPISNFQLTILFFGILVGKRNPHRSLLLHPVAVHVNRFEQAAGEVFLFWAPAASGS